MPKFTLKRSVYFVSLSAFVVIALFMIGFILAKQIASAQPLPTIDTNSPLFISLRVLIYGTMLWLWHCLTHRLATTTLYAKDSVNQTQPLLTRSYRYRLPIILGLFECLLVQQGWTTLVHAMR